MDLPAIWIPVEAPPPAPSRAADAVTTVALATLLLVRLVVAAVVVATALFVVDRSIALPYALTNLAWLLPFALFATSVCGRRWRRRQPRRPRRVVGAATAGDTTVGLVLAA